MKIRSAVVVLLSVLVMTVACDKSQGKESEEKSSTEVDDIFYSIGLYESRMIKQLDPSEQELEQYLQGIRDAVNDSAKFDEVELQEKIPAMNNLVEERMNKQANVHKEKGKEYLKDYASNDDVKMTESGIAYKITQEGSGKHPSESDTVKVHYEGRLIDGTVFDSSKKRGEPVDLPLNGVIPGWKEGIQLVKEGGSIELVIPSDLAYGDRDNGAIPGGSTLIFDVELIEIVN